MKRFISIGILSFLVFAAAPFAHAAFISPMPTFENQIVLKSAAPDAAKKVHDAILSAAAQYKWRVVSDNGETLRLNLVVRKHELEVDVHILGSAVNVDYVSSVNMGYAKDGIDASSDHCNYVSGACSGGGVKDVIHMHYGKWVKNL
ncbi:MAG: hypothetical protein LBI68_07455, partial [Azoarcus sp.]|nr:hypothetical protein [Azoarcus sp.]